jgi:hypothetical protein
MGALEAPFKTSLPVIANFYNVNWKELSACVIDVTKK